MRKNALLCPEHNTHCTSVSGHGHQSLLLQWRQPQVHFQWNCLTLTISKLHEPVPTVCCLTLIPGYHPHQQSTIQQLLTCLFCLVCVSRCQANLFSSKVGPSTYATCKQVPPVSLRNNFNGKAWQNSNGEHVNAMMWDESYDPAIHTSFLQHVWV